MKQILKVLEMIIWESRIVVVVGALAAIITGVILFVYGSMEVLSLFEHFWNAIKGKASWSKSPNQLIQIAINTSTLYLSAGFMYILGTGLYELFVQKIDDGGADQSNVLISSSLESLKEKLIKIIHITLVLLFFRLAIQTTFKDALHLLYLALAIVLIAGSVYLAKK